MALWSRVARWYIFRPKIAIWLTFGGPCDGRYEYNWWIFGLFFPLLVYCTKKNLATMLKSNKIQYLGIRLFLTPWYWCENYIIRKLRPKLIRKITSYKIWKLRPKLIRKIVSCFKLPPTFSFIQIANSSGSLLRSKYWKNDAMHWGRLLYFLLQSEYSQPYFFITAGKFWPE
jgi:hypothetical protein